jgi:hypothetical protein
MIFIWRSNAFLLPIFGIRGGVAGAFLAHFVYCMTGRVLLATVAFTIATAVTAYLARKFGNRFWHAALRFFEVFFGDH